VSGFGAALWVEALKARRSKAWWLTALGFSLLPLVGALFMLILRDPEWARSTGLLTAKARALTGSADWPSYWTLIEQGTAAAALFIFGIIVTWVFGREYSDRTAKDLLALPTSREAIVLAKLVVIALWSLLLTGLIVAVTLGLGALLGLPGGSTADFVQAVRIVAVVAGMTIVVLPPFAWMASAGRGYLPSIGMMFVVVALGQVLATLGWGAYFPWSVPAMASGAAGAEAAQLGVESYVSLLVACIGGIVGTLVRWRLADQT
jgi:ABC-2 type transport system permease protein